jgi:hypothetical protein
MVCKAGAILMADLPVLSVKEKAGDGGVTRLTYWLGSKHIGSARIIKTTLGEITVRKYLRRRGYGTAMLRDLENRGVTHVLVVSDGEAAFFKQAGWITRENGWWTKPTEERRTQHGKLFASPWWQVQTLFLHDIII